MHVVHHIDHRLEHLISVTLLYWLLAVEVGAAVSLPYPPSSTCFNKLKHVPVSGSLKTNLSVIFGTVSILE